MEIYYYVYNIFKTVLCTGICATLLTGYDINKNLALILGLMIFFLPFIISLFFTFMFVIALVDQKYFKISNTLVLASIILSFVITKDFYSSFFSGIFFALPLFLLYIASQLMDKQMVGAGDVKLFFALGTFFATLSILPPLYFLILLGSFPYFFLSLRIPMGPPTFFATYMVYIFRIFLLK